MLRRIGKHNNELLPEIVKHCSNLTSLSVCASLFYIDEFSFLTSSKFSSLTHLTLYQNCINDGVFVNKFIQGFSGLK